MIGTARKFIQHVVPGVIRPLRVLWNEVIGFLFLALAVLPVPSIVREFRAYEGGAEGMFRILLGTLFSLIMGWFGLSSFLKARKISRS